MIVSTTFLRVVWLSLCVSHDYEVVADVGDVGDVGGVGGVGRGSMREWCSSVLRCGTRSAPARSIDLFRSLPRHQHTSLSIHPHPSTLYHDSTTIAGRGSFD